MRLKFVVFFLAILVLFGFNFNTLAAENTELRELKEQLKILKEKVKILQEKIEEIETKKIKKTEAELDKLKKEAQKRENILKKLQEKTRLKLSGEVRFRFDSAIANTPADFVYPGQPSKGQHRVDWCSWPMRFRLQFEFPVISNYLDLYGRFTINKRFGKIMYFGTGSNPHDWYNAYAAHQGGDLTPRLENLFVIAKPPYVGDKLPVKVWFGRLRGYEGPPSRGAKTIFPRLFVDSEIEGGLIEIGLPQLPFEETLTEFEYKLFGEPQEPTLVEKERNFKKIARSNYFKKLKAKNKLFIGHLKYNDVGLTGPGGKFEDLMGIGKGPDSNCFISQLQLKLTKDTQLFLNYAYMHAYYMPRYSFYITKGHNFKWSEPYEDSEGNRLIIPYIEPKPYHLGGIYLDTQLWRFQVYGAYYWSYFEIAPHKHRWLFSEGKPNGKDPRDYGYVYKGLEDGKDVYEKEFKGKDFLGHAWFIGFNTGNLLGDKLLLWCDVTNTSKYWINPFNCKGYRRKGTVHYLSNNYFYNPGLSSDTIVVGYFPFPATIVDFCLTYYFHPKSYLLIGTMYFDVDPPRKTEEDYILGCSGRESYWYPHIEWKIFF